MPLSFYTDVHISKRAVEQLRLKGVDIIHCSDIGNDDLSDIDHLEYAIQNNRVMVSCDDDFEILHWQWKTQQRDHMGIVYISMKDYCKNIGVIVEELTFLYLASEKSDELKNQLWKVRRSL
jgi:predicted nuclease of predicted toxin-antitoxin system